MSEAGRISRTSIGALALAFIALVIGVAAPALDPAVLREQLLFAQRTTGRPEPAPPQAEEPRLRDEAKRWLTNVLRKKNDEAVGRAASPPPAAEEGAFGASAKYVMPAQLLIALAGLGLALVDWVRTRHVRANLTAGLTATAAIVLPFAWSAIAIGLSVAAALIALMIVGSLFG